MPCPAPSLPLPPLRTGASSSASTMEGGRAQQGCLPLFRRPSRLPRPKPRRARIPRSDSPKVFGHGRTRALGCSFFPSLPRLPSTHALSPSFCVGGESTAVAAATAGKGDDGRPPSSPPSIYNTMYVRLLLPRLSSSSPLFSPALSDTLPILTRPRISGKRASRGYALRLYSLPRDDKRRSGSLPLSHLISVFPREERVEEAVRTGQATRNKDRGNQIGTKAKGTIARTFDFAS